MSDAARHPAPRGQWFLIGGIAAIVVLAVAVWFTFGTAGAGKPAATAMAPPAPAVGVRPVATRPVSRSFEFVGRVKAVNTVEVRARIEGFLDKVLFTEGQDVKAGAAAVLGIFLTPTLFVVFQRLRESVSARKPAPGATAATRAQAD